MASIINATVTSPGGLVTTGDNTNELKIQTGETDAVTVNSSQVVTFNNPIVVGTNAINAENSLGFRNRLINSDMRIDQRNAGASVTAVNNTYCLDRWQIYSGAASKFSVQQVTDAPAGFGFSLKVTSLSAYSVGASESFNINQFIEGFNTVDLSFGTASAKSITISFWVRSSLTGTFGGAINNASYGRSYPFTYSISSADTWEQKSVTIAGDTSGTWVGATNGIGVIVSFGLGNGASVSGTAGAWNSNVNTSATGATSVVGTNGATWYVTGVQLEVGSVATPFERRPYGTELQLCLRYAFVATSDVLTTVFGRGTTTPYSQIVLPVQMRASPTPTISGSLFVTANGASGGDITATSPTVSANGLSNIGGRMAIAGFNSALTNNYIYAGSSQGASGKITFSAEL